MVPTSVTVADEELRLRTLHRQHILDSLQESIFETFVRLAAHIFSLPISLISVTDAAETVYIANQGLAGLLRQPRSEAICSMVVREGKAVVFTDLSQPEAQPLTPEAQAAVRRGAVRFYAGVPLRMPDQHTIGTLCVIGYQPRVFSDQEQQALEKVAALIARIIVVRSYCRLKEPGETYWQQVQALLVKEVAALNALVQHVVTHSEVGTPVAPHILKPVMQRLQEVDALLDEYSYGKA